MLFQSEAFLLIVQVPACGTITTLLELCFWLLGKCRTKTFRPVLALSLFPTNSEGISAFSAANYVHCVQQLVA